MCKLRLQSKIWRIFCSRVTLCPRAQGCHTRCRRPLSNEFAHIPFKPCCTSCVDGKAQSEPHKRIERTAEDSELPIVQCDYLVCTSTVVESKGATDTFAVTWKVKMWNCLGLRHQFAVRSRTITHQVGRKCKILTSRANSHPKFTQTITSEQRSSGKLSEAVAGTGAHNVGST